MKDYLGEVLAEMIPGVNRYLRATIAVDAVNLAVFLLDGAGAGGIVGHARPGGGGS